MSRGAMLSSIVMPYGVTLRVVRAVEVGDAHVERIAPERARDLVDHVLDREHALRPAEAAERRIGHRVGLAAVSCAARRRAASTCCRSGTPRGR